MGMRVLIIGTQEDLFKCIQADNKGKDMADHDSLGYDYLNPYLQFRKSDLIGCHPEKDAMAYEVFDCRNAPEYRSVFYFEKDKEDKYEKNRYFDLFRSLSEDQVFTVCDGHL